MKHLLHKNIFWGAFILFIFQGLSFLENKVYGLETKPNYFRKDLTTDTNSYPRKPLILVIHSIAFDIEGTLKIFREGKVVSHYTIDLNGGLYQHADESITVKHAGTGVLSYWHGYDVNSRSIGIENVNGGSLKNPPPQESAFGKETVYKGGYYWHLFPDAQIDRLTALALEIIKKYDILPEHVLAHQDVAPQRKIDPGPAFPWLTLARKGVGICYDPSQKALVQGEDVYPLVMDGVPDTANIGWMQDKLANWGYQVPQTGTLDKATQQVILAFNAHYLGNYDPFITHEAMAVINTLIHYRNHRDLPPQGSP